MHDLGLRRLLSGFLSPVALLRSVLCNLIGI
jgi:hypothetical protein